MAQHGAFHGTFGIGAVDRWSRHEAVRVLLEHLDHEICLVNGYQGLIPPGSTARPSGTMGTTLAGLAWTRIDRFFELAHCEFPAIPRNDEQRRPVNYFREISSAQKCVLGVANMNEKRDLATRRDIADFEFGLRVYQFLPP